MSKTCTELKDLAAGDVIYPDIIIQPQELVNPNSKTTTARKVRKGEPVKRICVVLVPGKTSVQVTYLATFNQSSTLPTVLDKSDWYPISPATQEGPFAPLPARQNGRAQWACLIKKHTITEDPVEKFDDSEDLPIASVNIIRDSMKA